MKKFDLLLVEDDREFLDLIVMHFEARGLEVDRAKSVAEALEKLSTTIYKAISLDVFLGEQNCAEILKEIQSGKLPYHTNTPVVICTAHSTPEFHAKMKEKGYRVFSKREKLEEYYGHISSLCEKGLSQEFNDLFDSFSSDLNMEDIEIPA